MAFRIAPREEPDRLPQATKKPRYLAWLHELPCIITKIDGPVEACHVSFKNQKMGHMGRAKSRKAHDRWALPMKKALHDRQHSMSEPDFWNAQNIDPHRACLVLWGLWSDDPETATAIATRLIRTGAFVKHKKNPPPD